jgi:hypothetical protein
VAATSSSQDQEIIKLLESLKALDAEYPSELLAARRGAFIEYIARRQAGVREALSVQDQEIVQLLETLGSRDAEYPSELLAARRAVEVEKARPSKNQAIIDILQSLESAKAEYPPELRTARRAAFIRQIAQRSTAEIQEEEMPAQAAAITRGFAKLKSVEPGYPSHLLAARRAAFRRQVARERGVTLLDALRSAIQRWFSQKGGPPLIPMRALRTSLIMAGILAATLVGSMAYGGREHLSVQPTPLAPQEHELAGPVPPSATSTDELAEPICKPGYAPPLCLAKEFDQRDDLTFQGNGARAAVAKDTLPGYTGIHQAAYANDGLYGHGASWVSNSAYSWIKIDLGKTTAINTVTFGRDRLGNFNDRDPGQFVIAVAMFDNIYADGNSSNDNIEYIQVYNSQADGFTGNVSGAETIRAAFGPVLARFVKITFANAGTAIDEVEAFMVQPHSVVVNSSTNEENDPRRHQSTLTPRPTNTLVPTDTFTPVPTNTPQPTDTPLPPPTDTPLPPPTDTPLPPPTDTPAPLPTDLPPIEATPTDFFFPIVPP